LLTQQFIVFFMAADPVPEKTIGHFNGYGTIMYPDATGPKAASFFQM
jgi:hypothetical protein